MVTLKLKDEYAEMVFDILCNIPFETPTMSDSEPPTTRYQGIEDIISQLQEFVYPNDEIEE